MDKNNSERDLNAIRSTMDNIAHVIEKRYDCIQIASGMSKFGDFFTLGFNIYRNVSKDEIRKMLLASVNIFLQTIHENEQLKEYLLNKPILMDQIHVSFYLLSAKGYPRQYPDLSSASIGSGKVTFYRQKPNTEYGQDEESETFEEALAIVKKQELEQKNNA